jgi:hypothetical protein
MTTDEEQILFCSILIEDYSTFEIDINFDYLVIK